MPNLNDELLKYYQKYVHINDRTTGEAQAVFKTVKFQIADDLRQTLLLELPGVGIEGFIDTGSAKEGLKVVRPDEFDVMILYKLGRKDDYEWVMTPSDEDDHICQGMYSFVNVRPLSVLKPGRFIHCPP